MRRFPIAAVVTCVLLLLMVAPTFAQDVSAQFLNVAGISMGTITLEEGESGLDVEINVAGFEPVAGSHRVAVTEVGLCEGPAFESAGDEVAELPNLQFYPNGSGELRATLDIDPALLTDSGGSAVVIYADTGADPGERIACAVIADTGESAPPAEEPAPEEEEDAGEEEAPAPPGGPRGGPVVELPAPGSVLESDLPIPESTEAQREEIRELLEAGVAGFFEDVNDRIVGDIVLLETDEGELHLVVGAVLIGGMDPVAGAHRAAIVSTDQCNAPDFSTAGEEILLLPEIPFNEAGGTEGYFVLEGLQLSNLMDEDGSAIVLYEGNNENPGNRFMCAPLMTIEDFFGSVGVTIEEFLDDLGL